MDASIGDRIQLPGRTLNQPTREGRILDVERGSDPMYRVAWDDGSESMFTPGPGQMMVTSRAERDDTPSTETQLDCRIQVHIDETEDRCEATTTLTTSRGTFTGTGVARRNPADPSVPMIGEELAISRALRELADTLAEAARDSIDAHEDREIHLIES